MPTKGENSGKAFYGAFLLWERSQEQQSLVQIVDQLNQTLGFTLLLQGVVTSQ